MRSVFVGRILAMLSLVCAHMHANVMTYVNGGKDTYGMKNGDLWGQGTDF